jgi:NAD(P)-dependent dehydrogenase (short-subunit alcohol dehydrogenase family)
MAQQLQGRVAVVTGASRGVGRAAALALAEAGAHVIALARTQGALEELDDQIRERGGSATLVPVDVKDYPALDRLGAAIHQRWGKLDILVGNAGILGELAPITHIDPPVWDDVMAVNVTANWRLIRSLDPLLRASDAGRAIFLTSGAAEKCTAYWGPYSVSKAALEALVRTYAAETVTTPVRVMLISPGPLRTAMRQKAMPGEDPLKLRTPEELAPEIVRLADPAWTDTGKILDFQTGALMTVRRQPAD